MHQAQEADNLKPIQGSGRENLLQCWILARALTRHQAGGEFNQRNDSFDWKPTCDAAPVNIISPCGAGFIHCHSEVAKVESVQSTIKSCHESLAECVPSCGRTDLPHLGYAPVFRINRAVQYNLCPLQDSGGRAQPPPSSIDSCAVRSSPWELLQPPLRRDTGSARVLGFERHFPLEEFVIEQAKPTTFKTVLPRLRMHERKDSRIFIGL